MCVRVCVSVHDLIKEEEEEEVMKTIVLFVGEKEKKVLFSNAHTNSHTG